jgi:hypothetical protein
MKPEVRALLGEMVYAVIDRLEAMGYRVPLELKTLEYYARTLKSLIRALYRNEISQFDFVTSMSNLVQEQLTRAWREGMRQNDLDPDTDMIDRWQQQLDTIILNEYMYVDQFAADIVAASMADDTPSHDNWGALLSRADMWANRYNETVNKAVLATKEQKLIWVYGDTEHCETCLRLNGIVAFASEWELSGVRPQNAPNPYLDCGGWNCACSLVPTANRHTRNAWDAIMRAVGLG